MKILRVAKTARSGADAQRISCTVFLAAHTLKSGQPAGNAPGQPVQVSQRTSVLAYEPMLFQFRRNLLDQAFASWDLSRKEEVSHLPEQ
jgi:hypothetical protein